ncbi:MAG TPA: hypothetical protein VHC63_13450 [Acidimicrobiales bacterium]|nr:hypothetical protein [Acidimicrobiales bacterium]
MEAAAITLDERDGCIVPIGRPKWTGPWRLVDGRWQRGYLTLTPPIIVTKHAIGPEQAAAIKAQFERAVREDKPMVMSECDIKRVEVEAVRYGPKVED